MTDTDFDRAVSRYQFALDRLHNDYDLSDENSNFLTDALVTAEDAVMREPAQDFDQLRIKADIVWSDPNSLPPDRHVSAFFADLVRLTGAKPSRMFDPVRWLARFERRGGGWIVRDDTIFLMWPDPADIQDMLMELEMRGGRPAVLDLIRTRYEAQEA